MGSKAFSLAKIDKALTSKTADPYWQSFAVWLEGKPANTRRSYYGTVTAVLQFSQKHPSEILPIDIARWKEHLKIKGCSDSTIGQRLSAVSSYYQFLQVPQLDGTVLHQINPVKGVQRNDIKVSHYDKSKKISVSQFRKIMAAIDTTRPSGALYKAAFLFYVLCGRRRSEVVSLYGRDIRVDDKKVTYKVRLKGGKTKWKVMPPPVWNAIQYYLYSTNRKLEDDKPVFVATKKYKRRTDTQKETKPLRGSTLFKAIKRYARKAGIDPKKVSLHSLRHLGAELFLNASEDIHETQLFLDHAHLNTTQIYLAQLKGEEHNHWQEMANKLRVK